MFICIRIIFMVVFVCDCCIDLLVVNPSEDIMQSMDIDRNIPYKKRKSTEYEGNVYNPKVH